jgi:hypothetical protein
MLFSFVQAGVELTPSARSFSISGDHVADGISMWVTFAPITTVAKRPKRDSAGNLGQAGKVFRPGST